MTPREREAYRLGRLGFERGDARAAREHLERLLPACRDFADIHYMLGVSYEREGDLDSAAHSLEDQTMSLAKAVSVFKFEQNAGQSTAHRAASNRASRPAMTRRVPTAPARKARRCQSAARRNMMATGKSSNLAVSFGLETRDRDLLKEICKGATPEEMVEGGRKAKEAGFEYSFYVLLGAGGEERWEPHARGTATVLNQIDPHFIRIRTLVPQPSCSLYEAVAEGRFQMAGLETLLKETRLLLEELEVTSQFLSDHISNLLPLHGKVPEDKDKMVRMVEEALIGLGKDAQLREEMEARRHLKNL